MPMAATRRPQPSLSASPSPRRCRERRNDPGRRRAMTETTLATANLKITHDKKRNMARFIEAIDDAAAKGARALVLPEAGLQGYADFAFPLGSAEAAEQKQYYAREAETIP